MDLGSSNIILLMGITSAFIKFQNNSIMYKLKSQIKHSIIIFIFAQMKYILSFVFDYHTFK